MAADFEIPDTTTALPSLPFEFGPAAPEEASAILALEPSEIFHRLLRDQESEAVLLASRRILAAFFTADRQRAARHDTLPHDADGIADHVLSVREELAAALAPLDGADAGVRERVLRERAPLGLVAGCWLDMLSQPATQPAVCVNRLVAHQWELRGAGNPRRSLHHARRRRLEHAGIDLPPTGAADFFRSVGARPLTALHAALYVALSRLPANFIPEVVGVHYVFFALGVDDLQQGAEPLLGEPALRAMLAEYLALAGEAGRDRLRCAIRMAVDLEREHVGLLAELATWLKDLPLESQVAEIVRRRAPMAGSQHGRIRVGGRRLAEAFRDPDLDVAAFLAAFRESPYVRPDHGGNAPFIQAMKFGGPMFGIFDEREAGVFKAWVASVQAGERPPVEISLDRSGDVAAARWSAAIAAASPEDVVVAEAPECGDRELFYRLVNIENFPNMLAVVRRRAEERFVAAELLFTYGGEGRYTDASWFDYSPQALFERGERVYWDKLVDPYEPLAEIPDRDEVIFAQSTYALASLIDGTWIHRVGNLGHRERDSDEMIYTIYADEMGHGDLRKNHLTLVHRLLASLDIHMPHIRDAAFVEQRDLPDELYGASLHQMCMALHPDTFYNEILGYNFAIEMFGSGEFRLHEIQKLRHYGFDDCYEQAHLAIDNFSSGHTRQAADIIVSHLDHVRRTVGEAAVAAEWRRIWRGYASYAWFVEAPLVKRLLAEADSALAGAGGAGGAGGGGDGDDMADLVL